MAAAGGAWKGGSFVPASGPQVMTFDEYAARQGTERFAWDTATNRLPSTSEGQRRRIQQKQYAAQQTNAQRREALQAEYNSLIASGRVRQPSRVEALLRTARGHEDNASVQAARRLLAKRGIDWRTAQ